MEISGSRLPRVDGRCCPHLTARNGRRSTGPQARREQNGIPHFESILLRRLTSKRNTQTRESTERLRARRRLDAAALARSLKDLGSQIQLDPLADHIKATADPVFLACRVVGKAEGFAIVAAKVARERSVEERVHWIAKASGARSRRIMLRGPWWKQTTGPIVGVLEESRAPVTLLPRKRGYDMLDPVTEKRTRINEKTANLLEVAAYVLYGHFPENR